MNLRGLALRFVLLGLCAAPIGAGTAPADTGGGSWRVVDPGGRGVAGAAVTLYGVPVTESPIERQSTRISTATSGDDGAVAGRLPQVPELVVAVDQPRFAPRVAAGAPDVFRVVRLDPGRSWSGRVQGADHRTVSKGEACVRFSLAAPRLDRDLDFERCAALESGRFTIEGLPSNASGRLDVTAPGFLPWSSSFPPPAGGPLVLEPGVLLSGRVVAANGDGLSGAKVAVAGGETALSERAGRFAVRAPRLPADVTFRAAGHREKMLTVTRLDPAKPMVVRLAPGPTLVASILGGDGRRPERAVVRLLRYRAEKADWGTVTRVVLEGAQGKADGAAEPAEASAGSTPAEPLDLDVDLPDQGRYRLTIEAPGYRRYEEPTFAVGPAEQVDLGSIYLSQGGGVVARVMDERTGEPVPGALAQLSPTGTEGVLETLGVGPPAASSDADGRLRIVGQEAGTFELQVKHRGYGTRVLDVELGRDELRDLGSVWLGPGAEVQGRVRDRSGAPRPGLQVRIVGASEGSLSTVAERTTGSDGRFESVRVGAGDYRVEVHGTRLLLDQGFTISENDPGTDLDLEVGGTHWRGRVVRGERPVTGGILLVRPMSDTSDQRGRVMVAAPGMEPQILGESGAASSATLSREGAFDLEDAPTGLVLATYLGEDGKEARERLFVAPRAEVRLDIHLTASDLEGTVLDAEQGTPLAGATLRLRDPLDTVVADAVSAGDGSFRLTGFDLATDYQLEAELAGYRPWLLRGVRAEQQRDSPLRVLLQPAASSSLQVRLERSDGSRPGRAMVSLFSEGGWMLRSQILDTYGEIVFDDVAPGRYFLLWYDPLTGTGAAPVEVGDDGPTRFDRLLEPGAPLTLDCGDRCAGDSLPPVAVVTDSGLDLTSHLPAISPALRFSPSGRLALGRLQPGSYLIRTWLDGRQLDRRVIARAGEPLAVDLGGQSR